MGGNSSTRRGGGRKLCPLPRKFVFLGFRGRKIHPKKSTQNKKVHLNRVFWKISVRFLTRVTGKKAKVHVNFSKSSCERGVSFWYFWILGGFWGLCGFRGRDRSYRRRILGQYSAAPCSPGPFVVGEGQKGTRGRGRDRNLLWQSVPLTPIGFVLRAPYLLNQFPFFSVLQKTLMGGAGWGASDDMGLEGKGTGLSWHFLTFFFPSLYGVPFFGERLRGNTIRGNRPERFWEGNLPLRGSLRGSPRGRVFRGFRRFSEDFRGFSKALSEPLSECHFPLSCGSCCP